MEKVAAAAREANPQIETKIIPLDLQKASSSDYANLMLGGQHSIVINNAGVIDRIKFFEEPLENIQALIKTNVHPYVLLAKYAALHFR